MINQNFMQLLTNIIVIIIVFAAFIVLLQNFIKGIKLIVSADYAHKITERKGFSLIRKFLRDDSESYYKVLRAVVGPFLVLMVPLAIIAIIGIALQFIEFS